MHRHGAKQPTQPYSLCESARANSHHRFRTSLLLAAHAEMCGCCARKGLMALLGADFAVWRAQYACTSRQHQLVMERRWGGAAHALALSHNVAQGEWGSAMRQLTRRKPTKPAPVGVQLLNSLQVAKPQQLPNASSPR